MTSSLSGRSALITGGASGIGEATARLLHDSGVRVVIADVDDARGALVAAELGIEYVHLDVASADDWDDVTHNRTFDMGVLNAGVGARFEDLRTLDDASIEQVMNVNVKGVVLGTRALVRCMTSAGVSGGNISVTASLAGLAAHTQSPLYGASKWAVIGWVRAIAPSMADLGVTLNAVCPGLVDTPILGPGGGDRMREMGMSVLDAAEVAAAHVTALEHSDTGTIFTVQAGKPIGIHTFAPVEGYQG